MGRRNGAAGQALGAGRDESLRRGDWNQRLDSGRHIEMDHRVELIGHAGIGVVAGALGLGAMYDPNRTSRRGVRSASEAAEPPP